MPPRGGGLPTPQIGSLSWNTPMPQREEPFMADPDFPEMAGAASSGSVYYGRASNRELSPAICSLAVGPSGAAAGQPPERNSDPIYDGAYRAPFQFPRVGNPGDQHQICPSFTDDDDFARQQCEAAEAAEDEIWRQQQIHPWPRYIPTDEDLEDYEAARAAEGTQTEIRGLAPQDQPSRVDNPDWKTSWRTSRNWSGGYQPGWVDNPGWNTAWRNSAHWSGGGQPDWVGHPGWNYTWSDDYQPDQATGSQARWVDQMD